MYTRERLGRGPPPQRLAELAVDEVLDLHTSSSSITALNSTPLGKPSNEAVGALFNPFLSRRARVVVRLAADAAAKACLAHHLERVLVGDHRALLNAFHAVNAGGALGLPEEGR